MRNINNNVYTIYLKSEYKILELMVVNNSFNNCISNISIRNF